MRVSYKELEALVKHVNYRLSKFCKTKHIFLRFNANICGYHLGKTTRDKPNCCERTIRSGMTAKECYVFIDGFQEALNLFEK